MHFHRFHNPAVIFTSDRACWENCSRLKVRQFCITQMKIMQWKWEDDDNVTTLAFVPENDVTNMYEKLTNSDLFRAEPENADFLIIYFEDNFGRIRRDCRSRPQFAINHWNQQERVTNDLSRTNNAAEGWHNAFHPKVNIAHSTAGRLARKLQ